MNESARSSNTAVTQPAGTYTVETVNSTLDNLSFIAYRRVSTSIMLPAIGAAARQRQVIFIDPLQLEAAVKRDAQRSGECLLLRDEEPNLKVIATGPPL